MIRNYILVACRSLMKNKLFSFINIFGLALSMTVCMIVLIRIVDSLAYDNFHRDEKLIYRIISNVANDQGQKWKFASTPLPLAATIREDKSVDSVVTTTFFYPAIHETANDGAREFQVNGIFAQPSYFDLFGFTLKYGDIRSALDAPRKVLLAEHTAKKFYGELDPRGKILTLGNLGEFEISGVISAPPSKSHINYDVIASMSTVAALEQRGLLPRKSETWDSFENGYTYVKLHDADSHDFIQTKLDQLALDITKQSTSGSFYFELQPLSSITPGPSDMIHEIGRGPTIGSLLAETGIVLIILFAACFNYTNLSIARALTRSKEVGIRKLSGAQRWQIFAQYISEAILIAILSLIVAGAILAPILEYKPFNDAYEMVPAMTLTLQIFLIFLGFAVFAGIMAGAFPAWILSAFRPARILRGVGTEKIMGNLSLRKSLMVFQFALSLTILVFLSTFYKQFNYMAKADPGFNRKGIMLVPAGRAKDVTATAFSRLNGVKNTGFTSDPFGGNSGDVMASRQIGDPQGISIDQYFCDNNWISMMKLNLLEGTLFLNDSDSSVIINEKSAQVLGFGRTADAIGSMIYLQDSLKTRVSGVVKDFYAQGYGNAIQPLVLRNIASAGKFIAIESNQNKIEFVHSLEHEWKKQNPGNAFEYFWLDEEMKKNNDQSAEISLLGFLGFMTVTIASLGLLGLVVYTVETRRKEISVRKIIGASVRQIISLLSRSFVSLLMLSGLIALPIGYFLSKIFLTNFVNQVPVGITDLLLCFGLLLSIGLTTILSQTWKAAEENPSRNLRSE
jgi:putative ABC transport system permease protein